MRYKQEILIDRPREQVVAAFDDSDNLKNWLPDLVSYEHISGEPGKVGSKSRLKFSTKRGDFEMVETITKSDLPNEMCGDYDTVGKGMFNTMSNRFSEAGPGKTRYEIEIHYTFSGFVMRLMGLTMGWMFKRQSYKSMEQFKVFVESGSSTD